MSVLAYPWNLRAWLRSCPSVGCLMDLCDENYRHLMRLAPGLRRMHGRLTSRVDKGMDLHLEILEQTPYTTLLHLTYYFPHGEGQLSDPDAKLRIYYDSRQVEVLDLRQKEWSLGGGASAPGLEQKWKINLFLAKWLSYCLQQGHHFASQAPMPRPSRAIPRALP